MNKVLPILMLAFAVSCQPGNTHQTITKDKMDNQANIKSAIILEHEFLGCMYSDSYFPTFLVDKCKMILEDLCRAIEENNPQTLDELYELSHRSTHKINNLQEEFFRNNSEIETGARECLAEDFEFIAEAYGFEADVEELIATREW